MILLIDNQDSFIYNLYHLACTINPEIQVVPGDALTPERIAALDPVALILSPGPRKPGAFGICVDIIHRFKAAIPILGIGLGFQEICLGFGAAMSPAKTPMHGKQSLAQLAAKSRLFSGCPRSIPVARYDSWAIEKDSVPAPLTVNARGPDGEILGVEHQDYDIYGVQFHLGSIMTPDGHQVLKNFLALVKERKND